LYKSARTPPFKVTVCFTLMHRDLSETIITAGIAQRESGSGKLVTWEWGTQNFQAVGVHYWNSAGSLNSTQYGWANADEATYLRFLQIHDDGANVNYNFSYDGISWYTQYQRARTSLINADQYGFLLSEGKGSANFYSWHDEPA
jgi:hypothetical protein